MANHRELLKMADQLQQMALVEFNVHNNFQQSRQSVRQAQHLQAANVDGLQRAQLDALFAAEAVPREFTIENAYGRVHYQEW